MMGCWRYEPQDRLSFSDTRQQLASQLEEVTEDYKYLKLDQECDYYNANLSEYTPDIVVDGSQHENTSKLTSVDLENPAFLVDNGEMVTGHENQRNDSCNVSDKFDSPNQS